ncbi:hypothetical protein NLG97_g4932 [Lecanicillium saksenae]|uniref:Uncharacterized protein n=1 Tax=Lecanicillium saksenae TaxID=468837 RepID=A0ACC1QXS3_9HYPO|nr:hypothetical protein NLG97_g4932 [Lecanicillium saksenae]
MHEKRGTTSALIKRCLTLFTTATVIGDISADESAQLHSQKYRLKIWSQRFGAHLIGTKSLEYTLRDAPETCHIIWNALHDLAQLLEDYIAILAKQVTPWDKLDVDETPSYHYGFPGRKLRYGEAKVNEDQPQQTPQAADEQYEIDEDEDGYTDDDSEPATEREQIINHIKDTVGGLSDLVATLESPVQYQTFNSAVEDLDLEPKAVEFVLERHGALKTWQAERLGLANSRRERHFTERDFGSLNRSRPEHVLEENKPQAFHIFSPSTPYTPDMEPRESLRRLWPLPKPLERVPFDCPICRCMIVIADTTDWRKHLLEDLRPYICLQRDCPDADLQFARKRDWENHTRQQHANQYICPANACAQKFKDAELFVAHAQIHDRNDMLNGDQNALLALARIEAWCLVDSTCPFCREPQKSADVYHCHVGRHLEKLAWFSFFNYELKVGESSETGAEDPASLSHMDDEVVDESDKEIDKLEKFDVRELRKAASDGNIATATRILQLIDAQDDTESMVLAAGAGHYTMVLLLLWLGGFDPDPQPIRWCSRGVTTPMLAAIGQTNINVVKLLVQQRKFNPAKEFGGKRYYEYAEQRRGPNWEEEKRILKQAYIECQKAEELAMDTLVERQTPNRFSKRIDSRVVVTKQARTRVHR